MQTPKLLTIPEAAERLGVSDATVRRRIKDKSLKATKMPGPFGEQYYIAPEEISTAIEMVNVVPVRHEFGVQELEQLITQVVSQAVSQALSKPLEDIAINIAGIGSAIGEMKEENGVLKQELASMQESLAAMEARQETAQAAHYALVDERLKTLAEESKKGFWAKLFKK